MSKDNMKDYKDEKLIEFEKKIKKEYEDQDEKNRELGVEID